MALNNVAMKMDSNLFCPTSIIVSHDFPLDTLDIRNYYMFDENRLSAQIEGFYS